MPDRKSHREKNLTRLKRTFIKF